MFYVSGLDGYGKNMALAFLIIKDMLVYIFIIFEKYFFNMYFSKMNWEYNICLVVIFGRIHFLFIVDVMSFEICRTI